MCFFFNDTATTEIYTLSLHDALPICLHALGFMRSLAHPLTHVLTHAHSLTHHSFSHSLTPHPLTLTLAHTHAHSHARSEEHTSELQSRQYLVCRLLLEKTIQQSPSHV